MFGHPVYGPYFHYARTIVGSRVHTILIVAFLHYINRQSLAQFIMWVGGFENEEKHAYVIKVYPYALKKYSSKY